MISFAFVPIELFDEKNAALYLPEDKHQQRKATIISQKFDYYGIVGIFDNRQDKTITKHKLFELLELSEGNRGENIFIEVEDNKLYLIVVKDNKLLLSNVFEAEKDEDIAYFVLLSMESTDVDFAETNIKIINNRSSSLMPLLSKYVSVGELVV